MYNEYLDDATVRAIDVDAPPAPEAEPAGAPPAPQPAVAN
jgi:hypothetical protein